MRLNKWLIGSLITVLVMVGMMAQPTTALATPLVCAPNQLKIAIKRDFLAPGSFYFKIDLTNISHQSCSLDGYPTVKAWENGHQVGREAGHDTSVQPAKVLLKPVSVAISRLDEIDVTAFSKQQCEPVAATALLVSLPGSDKSYLLKHPLGACSTTKSNSPIFLFVRPVR